MTQMSYFWDGLTVGDAVYAEYSSLEFCDILRMLLQSDRAAQGPIAGYLNELAVTGTSSPLAVASGGALVNGRPYVNDAATTIAVPTPSAGHTRTDMIVLQMIVASQTTRIARHAGVEDGAAPALTQTSAVWEVPLAQVAILDTGVCTVTDRRSFVRAPIAPGYESSELTVGIAGGWAETAWNSIGAGIKFTLGPGKWILFAQLRAFIVVNDSTQISAKIYNNTYPDDIDMSVVNVSAANYYELTMHRVITLTAESEIELLYYPNDATDVVSGYDSGRVTKLTAMRVA